MPTFKINQGTNEGSTETLISSRIVIGCSPDCGLILTDKGIDLAHASIEARADRWVLQDLGTSGGTWINETPVGGPKAISSGDVIRLNDVLIEFESNGDDEQHLMNNPTPFIAIAQLVCVASCFVTHPGLPPHSCKPTLVIGGLLR